MKPIVFSNDEWTQTVTFSITEWDNGRINVSADFEPAMWKHDKESLHMQMAGTFFEALREE